MAHNLKKLDEVIALVGLSQNQTTQADESAQVDTLTTFKLTNSDSKSFTDEFLDTPDLLQTIPQEDVGQQEIQGEDFISVDEYMMQRRKRTTQEVKSTDERIEASSSCSPNESHTAKKTRGLDL